MSGEYFPYHTVEYMSALKTGLLELDQELKNQESRKEETVEMHSEIWSKLPQELLMRVISQLPTLFSGRFRAVCKGWKHLLSPAYTYQMLPSTIVQSSFPAFLISGVRFSDTRNLVQEDLSLLQVVPSPRIYRLSLNFCPYELKNLVTPCRSYLCCSGPMRGNSAFVICNPATRTYKTLPFTTPYFFHFVGFTFDASTRTFILVIGLNNCMNGERNKMEIQMYDSESDIWTQLEMSIPISIYPRGEGVYSRGRFYWINANRLAQGRIMTFRFGVAFFDVAAKHWDTIRLPQRQDAEDSRLVPTDCFWKLTGHDRKVVLVYLIDISLWKLNEDEEYSWSELQAFPRILYRHNTTRQQHIRWLKFKHPEVIVNSSGWVLLLMHGNRFVIFDANGRMMMNTKLKLERFYAKSDYQMSLHAYEINNIWWP